MARITRKVLEAKVALVCELLGRPPKPYVNGEAQVGCIYLNQNLHGYQIYTLCNESGGVHHEFGYNSMSASECAIVLDAIRYTIQLMIARLTPETCNEQRD